MARSSRAVWRFLRRRLSSECSWRETLSISQCPCRSAGDANPRENPRECCGIFTAETRRHGSFPPAADRKNPRGVGGAGRSPDILPVVPILSRTGPRARPPSDSRSDDDHGASRQPARRPRACAPPSRRCRRISTRPWSRFWYPRVIDRAHGGYRVAFAADGTPTADGSKMIVTQARMLWLFARLARAGYRVPEMREACGTRVPLPGRPHVGPAARRLRVGGRRERCARDRRRQGDLRRVVRAVRAGGVRPRHRRRRRAWRAQPSCSSSIDAPRARRRPTAATSRLFEPDWSAPPASKPSPIGGPAGAKLMNTHLHLLEAFAEYYRASHSAARARAALRAHRHPGQRRRPQGADGVHRRVPARLDAHPPGHRARACRTGTTSRTCGCSPTRSRPWGSRTRRGSICTAACSTTPPPRVRRGARRLLLPRRVQRGRERAREGLVGAGRRR